MLVDRTLLVVTVLDLYLLFPAICSSIGGDHAGHEYGWK
jgi:hypothetical protein